MLVHTARYHILQLGEPGRLPRSTHQSTCPFPPFLPLAAAPFAQSSLKTWSTMAGAPRGPHRRSGHVYRGTESRGRDPVKIYRSSTWTHHMSTRNPIADKHVLEPSTSCHTSRVVYHRIPRPDLLKGRLNEFEFIIRGIERNKRDDDD